MPQQSTPLDLNELSNPQPNEPTNFSNHFEDTAGPNTPSYHIPDTIFRIMVEHYTEQLAAKDLEIKVLSDKLSKLEDNSQQLSSELEQIKDECKQGILGIPEVQQALCEYNEREILFIFVLDDITRDLSDRLGEVEYGLRKKHMNWLIGFEYVEDRISSEQFEESQVEIFDRD